MPNPNGAGELPLDVELTGVVQIKKGNIQDCPRRGAKSNVAVRVSDGYGVLRARVDQLVRPQGVPADFTLYFKQTKNAVQSDYQPITEDNFEEWLRARWAKITRAEVDKWAEDQGKEPREIPVFEFFVYKPRQQVLKPDEFIEPLQEGLRQQGTAFNNTTINMVFTWARFS